MNSPSPLHPQCLNRSTVSPSRWLKSKWMCVSIHSSGPATHFTAHSRGRGRLQHLKRGPSLAKTKVQHGADRRLAGFSCGSVCPSTDDGHALPVLSTFMLTPVAPLSCQVAAALEMDRDAPDPRLHAARSNRNNERGVEWQTLRGMVTKRSSGPSGTIPERGASSRPPGGHGGQSVRTRGRESR